MALVLNCLDEEQTIMAGGNHFHFKPRQIKHFYQVNIANFIARDKQEHGFASLPDSLEDPASRETPEAKAIIEHARKQGVQAYCARLKALVFNAQVSIKQDLERSNLKADPRVFASDGDVRNLELLVKYQTQKDDSELKRVEKIKELEKQLTQKE